MSTSSAAPQPKSSARSFDKAVQDFPFTVERLANGSRIVVQLEGARIVLSSQGDEIGYLQMSFQQTKGGWIWELKDIIVHGEGMKGAGLGKLLVYFFARLACDRGAVQLRVLLQNSPKLYEATGFTVTRNANPHNPPEITGVPMTVRNTARREVDKVFRVVEPAPLPPPQRLLANDNVYGAPDIGNDQL